jgi:hypothetical protein
MEDEPFGVYTIWYTEGEIQASAYELWSFTIDLSDFSVADGAVVNELFIRGPVVPSFPETAGLDVVTIANLNEPQGTTPGDLAPPFGTVDVADLFLLLSNWNTDGAGADLAPPANIVNVADLFVLLANWG